MHKKWTGKEIRRFRESLELAQTKFAIEVGVEVWTINRWEREKFKPLPVFDKKLSALAGSCGYDRNNPKKVSLPKKEVKA